MYLYITLALPFSATLYFRPTTIQRKTFHFYFTTFVHRWHESAHRRADTLFTTRFVSFFLSLSPARTQCLYNISPDRRTAASSVLSAQLGPNKRGGERGLRFLNQRKLVLITLPLKKHSDPVNPHYGCQLQTMQKHPWESQPHPL